MNEPAQREGFEAWYARYAALGEGTKAELVANGEIRMLPRPRVRHVFAAAELLTVLRPRFKRGSGCGEGGWVILPEPEIRFGDQMRAPDIAGWRLERFQEPGDVAYFSQPPDWICEVLAPSTAKYDRAEKMPLFAEHGVSHVWLVDPAHETLEAYRREGALWVLLATYTSNQTAPIEPFEGIELDVGALFEPS